MEKGKIMRSNSKEKEKEQQQRGSLFGSASGLGYSCLSICEPGLQPGKGGSGPSRAHFLPICIEPMLAALEHTDQRVQKSGVILGSRPPRDLNGCPSPCCPGDTAITSLFIALIFFLKQPLVLSSFTPPE